ncbi:hypothetical protein HHUSO_G15856 [Huso huso]|uniref:Uncharacterized protein n=1 Tax=Huso huso TaxID=61971 RepID=A0ABR0ZD94_HUSHU
MPAGVSWPRYLKMFGASILTMFAGAEVVHQYYRPDLSIPEVPPKPVFVHFGQSIKGSVKYCPLRTKGELELRSD